MHPDFVILGRLVVAALLAGVLGWERERAGKSAGLRTHMLVWIAAALYTGLAEVARVELGARLGSGATHYVFSRKMPPKSVPKGVHFVTESIAAFADRLRAEDGKNIWMMGGGEIIASFLDAGAIDECILTVVPVFIGQGIPLIAPRHRQTPLVLLGVQQFPNGVVQLHYEVQRP